MPQKPISNAVAMGAWLPAAVGSHQVISSTAVLVETITHLVSKAQSPDFLCHGEERKNRFQSWENAVLYLSHFPGTCFQTFPTSLWTRWLSADCAGPQNSPGWKGPRQTFHGKRSPEKFISHCSEASWNLPVVETPPHRWGCSDCAYP